MHICIQNILTRTQSLYYVFFDKTVLVRWNWSLMWFEIGQATTDGIDKKGKTLDCKNTDNFESIQASNKSNDDKQRNLDVQATTTNILAIF